MFCNLCFINSMCQLANTIMNHLQYYICNYVVVSVPVTTTESVHTTNKCHIT